MKGDLPNYHLIVVSYLNATNARGGRLKLTSLRFGDSVLLSYDYLRLQGKETAIQYLNDNGFDPIGAGYDEKKGDTIVICKTFNSLKETKKIKR